MSKYSHIFTTSNERQFPVGCNGNVLHLDEGDIRNCRNTVDAFRIDDKGKITIINPTKPYRNPYVS